MTDVKKINILKASGELVPYERERLVRSLTRASANDEVIQKVLQAVEHDLRPEMSTKAIYKIAFSMLKRLSRISAPRYHLKRGIMELGPSGFPFERYVAEILRIQGYRVQTAVVAQGKCVAHEVDVIAEKDNQHFMIECKYHSHQGKICDVKIPLYIQSRFKDLEATWIEMPGHDVKLHQGWVVTNTRFSADAIKYGLCCGLHLIGWDYPKKQSLNEQIDRLGLYPLTCLTTITKAEKQFLLDNKMVLCREIIAHPELLRAAGVAEPRLKHVTDEAKQLCQKLRNSGQR